MSAAHQRQQIARICGKEETRKDANELLNIALSKTGPGSGHDLGEKAIALPAICAFLASERLGNNDVVKKVAQDVSCLKPKDFEAALSMVHGALSGYLSRRHGRNVTYKTLCHAHDLSDDALYWMEEVDKEVRKSGELRDLDAGEEAVIYMVFYWTCIALNIRSVKQATIISDYGVPLRVFQDMEDILDSTCADMKESMSKFANETRTSRSAVSTPQKSPRKRRQDDSELDSPSKTRTGASVAPSSTPTKTPRRMAASHELPDISPTKRKAVLPPLPFMTPAKKQKTSPMKLNRILPVTGNLPTPSKNTKDSASRASPQKTYGGARSFVESPAKSSRPLRAEELGNDDALEDAQVGETIVVEPSSTPVKSRANREAIAERSIPSTPSPRKSARIQTSVENFITPTRSKTRPPTKRRIDSSVQMEDVQAEVVPDTSTESSEDVETPSPPCRHTIPVFADRLFYHYRDPRVLREWEVCEKRMKMMSLERGQLSSDVAAH